jgi:hypothetical protein
MTTSQIDAARLSLLLNRLQETLDWRSRTPVANALAEITRAMVPPGGTPSPESRERAERLARDGLVRLGRILTQQQVDEIHAYLKTRPCFTGHVPAKGDKVPRSVDECARLANCASYTRADVLGAPHLLELANRPELLEIAEAYLGCTPTIYSINLFWSFPEREEKYAATQLYHRDFDDFRFCTLFVFLTDIRTGDGAHYFMRGTHRADFVEQAYRERLREPKMFPLERLFLVASYDDRDCQNMFHNEIELVVGSAGQGVFEDTYGLHKGDVPKTPRLLGWVRYGLYNNNTAYKDHPDGPAPRPVAAGRIPATARHQFINRLLVEP